jgi:hypothetical protein
VNEMQKCETRFSKDSVGQTAAETTAMLSYIKVQKKTCFLKDEG